MIAKLFEKQLLRGEHTVAAFFRLGGRVECEVGNVAHLQSRQLQRCCCTSSCCLRHEQRVQRMM